MPTASRTSLVLPARDKVSDESPLTEIFRGPGTARRPLRQFGSLHTHTPRGKPKIFFGASKWRSMPYMWKLRRGLHTGHVLGTDHVTALFCASLMHITCFEDRISHNIGADVQVLMVALQNELAAARTLVMELCLFLSLQ